MKTAPTAPKVMPNTNCANRAYCADRAYYVDVGIWCDFRRGRRRWRLRKSIKSHLIGDIIVLPGTTFDLKKWEQTETTFEVTLLRHMRYWYQQ